MKGLATKLGGHVWMIRHFGFGVWRRYKRERRRRERLYGRKFDAALDGAKLLRAIGATPLEIKRARKRGLA